MDFERAACKAAEVVFSGIRLKFCKFHLGIIDFVQSTLFFDTFEKKTHRLKNHAYVCRVPIELDRNHIDSRIRRSEHPSDRRSPFLLFLKSEITIRKRKIIQYETKYY